MAKSPKYSKRNSMESSFLHSLASIHKDHRRSRRATTSELEGRPPLSRPSTPPRGILRNGEDPPSPSQHRVSFAHHVDGTIRLDVSPGNYGSPSTSPQAARPSLSVMKDMPPLPLRSQISSAANRDMASMFANSEVRLPFATTPRSGSAPSRPVRRFSMMEMTQQDRNMRAMSPNSVATPASMSLLRPSDDDIKPQEPQVSSNTTSVVAEYKLGQVLRSSSHMNPDQTQVSSLNNYDFAFIKRTDGTWTYAILAYRSTLDNGEECMMFVMNEAGSTKLIRRRQWGEFVRCVARATEEVPRSIEVGHDDVSLVTFLS